MYSLNASPQIHSHSLTFGIVSIVLLMLMIASFGFKVTRPWQMKTSGSINFTRKRSPFDNGKLEKPPLKSYLRLMFLLEDMNESEEATFVAKTMIVSMAILTAFVVPYMLLKMGKSVSYSTLLSTTT